MINRTAYFIAVFSAIIFFISIDSCKAEGSKEELAAYLKDTSSIISNADITIRGIGFNTIPMSEGVKRLNTYIGRMEMIKYPETMSNQRTVILLAFKKLRMGLLLFSPARKDTAVRLIKDGSRLLRYAAKDIVAVAEKEGIKKPGEKIEKER